MNGEKTRMNVIQLPAEFREWYGDIVWDMGWGHGIGYGMEHGMG